MLIRCGLPGRNEFSFKSFTFLRQYCMNILDYLRKSTIGLSLFVSLTVFSQPSAKVKEVSSSKMGYISAEYVLKQQPEFKTIESEVAAKQQQIKAELKRLDEELQTKATSFQKEAPQLSDIVKLEREKELQHLQNRIRDFEQTAQEQVKTQSNQLIAPLIKKLQETVKAYASENNYRYIFNSDVNSPFPTLLYSPEEDNLNNSLLSKMGINVVASETRSKEQNSTELEKQKQPKEGK